MLNLVFLITDDIMKKFLISMFACASMFGLAQSAMAADLPEGWVLESSTDAAEIYKNASANAAVTVSETPLGGASLEVVAQGVAQQLQCDAPQKKETGEFLIECPKINTGVVMMDGDEGSALTLSMTATTPEGQKACMEFVAAMIASASEK